MSHQAPDIAAIVEKLKARARARPWEPLGVPPREHYHVFPNGLSICFTPDVLPGIKYWHLSIARLITGPAQEEIELWRHAFFDEEPNIVLEGPIGKHFYWGV